jgi:flagellin
MSINIRTNLSSLVAQKNLGRTTNGLTQAYERLSSGMRINKASDDAAGLAIADNLYADARLASVAIRNANDGISIIAITDGAIGQITEILSRLGELSEQSANGVYSNTQRSALQLEFSALTSEVARIAVTTQFNGLDLLSGGGNVVFQVGLDGGSISQLSYSGIDTTLASIGLADPNSILHKYSIIDSTVQESQSAARFALDAIRGAITSVTRSRGTLGAVESRLDMSIKNLEIARENYKAAETRIRDVDVAETAAELTRLNILQQAGVSVLSQANQQPSLALQLLGG